jgi:sugar O-acyltransferase (sialic acid O-acetyltransferase NeuD family)
MIAKSSRGRPVAIIGAGEHARVVLDICEAAGLSVAGFIGLDQKPGDTIDSHPILGNDDELLRDAKFLRDHDLVPGLGDQAARHRIGLLALAAGGQFARVVHPSSIVSRRALIAEGSVVCAGAIVNNGAKIGRFCIVNTGASVDHDCTLNDGVQVGPGAVLCGTVHCEADVLIGAGAIVLPGIRIGARAIVGAGAVVTRNVPPSTTVFGNPARAKS